MSRKQEIIEVCVEMIDKDGFQNLSIKTIADRIGIKPPSLYKHFQGGLDEIKEAMYYIFAVPEKTGRAWFQRSY